MITVLIPVCVLLLVILCKKIPVIGGNVQAALILAGILSLLLGGVFQPTEWIGALVDGIDRLAWIIFLSIFGSIYAETQVRLGTMETVMGALKAKFGKSPRALVICIILALVVAGSLLGDAIAAATVIGVLTIGTLSAIGLSAEHICCIIVMGASMGSIMPPITQALALSSTLVDTDPDPVIRMGYLTVSIVIILVCLYVVTFFVKKDMKIVEYDESGNEITDNKKASQILRENWRSLIPLFILILIVVFRTINIDAIKFDLGPELLGKINFLTINEETSIDLYTWLSQVTILKGLSNGIVLSLVIVTLISFCFKGVREDIKGTIVEGVSKVKITVILQLCAAFMLGCFYAGGQIDAVTTFAQGLNANVLKFGGAAAMMLIGMLTGSQSTAQNVVFSFFGPSLVNIGLNPTHVAIAGANLAAAGQGMPPADLTTFVVAGIVGGMLAKKVNPVKSMIYMIPMCLFFFIIGMTFLYI
jgi:Na+/H+ antiporter NhaC